MEAAPALQEEGAYLDNLLKKFDAGVAVTSIWSFVYSAGGALGSPSNPALL